MPGILAIDPGRVMGWALWRDGLVKPRAGVRNLPATEDMGWYMEQFLDWCIPFAKLERVTHFVIEAPIIAIHRIGGNGHPVIDVGVVRRTLTLVSTIEYAARQIDATCSESPRSTVAKHFTGYGGGKRKDIKAACFANCLAKQWNIASEDAADALATLDHYCFAEEVKVPWDCQPCSGPLFSRSRNVPNRVGDGGKKSV